MFGKEKKEQEFELEEKYTKALKKLNVPILTLDPKWHQLFPEHLKTKRLKKLEKNLNKLIKKQGQTNNDLKEYEKARKVIMDNILNNMTDGSDIDSPVRSKKQDKNQQLLEELQDKIQEANHLIDNIPVEIKKANQELLLESMRICYGTLLMNTERIDAEEAWISGAREILKEHILIKQEMELRNMETYKYMHDLLGAKVVNIFDQDHKIWKGEIAKEHPAESQENSSK